MLLNRLPAVSWMYQTPPSLSHRNCRKCFAILVSQLALLILVLRGASSATEISQFNNSQLVSQPKRTYSALCAVARNENAYIEEWVKYHRCLGIGKIYLYDHNSTLPMSANIQSYIDEGFVEYLPFDGSHTKWQAEEGFADTYAKFMSTIQGKAYQDCLHRFSSYHQFIGFIDVDEFVVLHDNSIRHIDDLLQRYKPFGGVSFYWIMLGSSGHRVRPVDWVTRSYLKCLPRSSSQNTQFKSFVNTDYRPTMYSPHRALFPNSTNKFLVNELGQPIPSGRNKQSTHEVAAIYHYVTKSKQDFEVKMNRGGGAGVTRPRHYMQKLDKYCKNTCYDAALQYARLCGVRLSSARARVALEQGGQEQAELQVMLQQIELQRDVLRQEAHMQVLKH